MLTQGAVSPHELVQYKGLRAVQTYLIEEVQKVYAPQGVDINDKHIECVVRQMFLRVEVKNVGDSEVLVPEKMILRKTFEKENEALIKAKKTPAKAIDIVQGIKQSALSSESFLSAASFQESARILTDAAIEGKIDDLSGMKSSVIVGKLIPAGTGYSAYRKKYKD
jgi:DNA-directed RNA polymerase subunit beta'